MHLVKEAFACPHCGGRLTTNIGRAYTEGVAIFMALMLAWFVAVILLGGTPFSPVTSLAFVVAFYLGHFMYRCRIKVILESLPIDSDTSGQTDSRDRSI